MYMNFASRSLKGCELYSSLNEDSVVFNIKRMKIRTKMNHL
jgi:hypothetical protein